MVLTDQCNLSRTELILKNELLDSDSVVWNHCGSYETCTFCVQCYIKSLGHATESSKHYDEKLFITNIHKVYLFILSGNQHPDVKW